MPQMYRCPKRIQWLAYRLPFAFSFLFAVNAMLRVSMLDAQFPSSDRFFLAIVAVSCAVAYFIFGIINYFRWGYEGICITLYEDELVCSNGTDYRYIRYEDIIRMDCPAWRLGNEKLMHFSVRGRLRLFTKTDSVRLPPCIENKGEIVRNLKDKLDERALSHCYNREDLFRFLANTTLSEQKRECLHEGFWNILATFLIWATAGYVIAVIAGGDSVDGLVAACVSFFFPVAPLSAMSRDFDRKFARESNLDAFTYPERDKAWEKYTFRRAILWTACIYTSICLAIIAASSAIG